LWQKLYYVKWNAKSFAMLARLAQDMAKNIAQLARRSLSNLVAQLEHHVKNCLTAGGIPQEPDRQRLTALIDALRHGLATDGRGTQPMSLGPARCWRRSRKFS
jgi:hypothetical protein